MTPRIRPLDIHVPDSALADLRDRIARTRLPETLEDVAWDDGTERSYLEELLAYWKDGFDWRRVEQRIARYDHVLVELGDTVVHCMRRRSPHPGALALVLTHGWPGSFLEFLNVVDPLADPILDDADPADAFDVVCFSLPGYGFSPAPRRRGFDIKRVGETIARVMAAFGYDRYGAQGGDWGAMASSYAALADPTHCVGLHLNMVLAPRPADDDASALSEREAAALAAARRYMREETGYQAIQTTRPQTLGYALNDSPAGLAAWLVEKYRAWSDCNGDVERRFSKDDILAQVTLYWLTETITSSMRLYRESRLSGRFGPVETRVEVPTGCAIYPKEMFRPPRRWAERLYNVVYWSELPSGGHFAAMEEPRLFVEDVRTFFRHIR